MNTQSLKSTSLLTSRFQETKGGETRRGESGSPRGSRHAGESGHFGRRRRARPRHDHEAPSAQAGLLVHSLHSAAQRQRPEAQTELHVQRLLDRQASLPNPNAPAREEAVREGRRDHPQEAQRSDPGPDSASAGEIAGRQSPEEPVKTKPPSTTSSPFKGQIDLNIQPEREEELSPGSDHVNTMKLLQDATERYLKQQRLLSDSVCSEALFGNQSQKVDGGDAGKPVDLGTSDHRDTDAETPPPPLAMKPPSVSPAAIG